MYPVTQIQLTFESGGRPIRIDCFQPAADGQCFPAVIGLHGSGGGYATMAEPATLLAQQGFAVYVLHYFDRTATAEPPTKPPFFAIFPFG